jgi:MFS family permease
VVMPVYGKLGDLLGRKPLFIAALSVFVVGCLLGGLAPDMTWLIVARAVQGLGGGGLLILVQALIADVVPARARSRPERRRRGVCAVGDARPRFGRMAHRRARLAVGVLAG